MNKLFLDTLPPATSKLTTIFQAKQPTFLDQFYLSGGTGLALQLGHRESEDLNFFNKQTFDPKKLLVELQTFGKLEGTELASGTLNTFLNGVKLQFLEYPYQLLEKTVDWQNIQVSSVIDIACTKLQTVSIRGSKKDFIDIYFLLKKYPLETLFKKSKEKYPQIDYNTAHILKSLSYFVDANNQPMPRMRQSVNWKAVKEKITQTVKNFKF